MTKGKRTAKKVFALLLSFIMVVCMMPGMAFAETQVDANAQTDQNAQTVQDGFQKDEYLKNLQFCGMSLEKASYPMTKQSDTEYTLVVPDNTSMCRVYAELADSASENRKITVTYLKTTDNIEQRKSVQSKELEMLGSSLKGNSLTGNTFTVTVGLEDATSEQQRVYTIHVVRKATIKGSLTIKKKQDGTAVELNRSFSNSIENYEIKPLIKGSESLLINPTATASGTKITINGEEAFSGKDNEVEPDWNGRTGTITIEVAAADRSSNAIPTTYTFTCNQAAEAIHIITEPTKTTYYVGEAFDPSGMVVEAEYADGTKEVIDGYTLDAGAEKLSKGTSSVTIRYEDTTASVPVTVREYFEEAGTQTDPYQISTVGDLQYLSTTVKNGETYEGKYFHMTTDLELPEDWAPIGALKDGAENVGGGKNIHPFSGTFDGGGNTITVLEDGLPLFGYVRNGTICNLDIYGTKIAGDGLVNNYEVDYGITGVNDNKTVYGINIDNVKLLSGSKTLRSGFLSGYASGMNQVNLTNCTVQENVIIGYDGTQSNIGSFAGGFNGTLINCTSAATVKGVNFVGGIIGDKGQTMGPCSISNCEFNGTVEASGDYAGGIAGAGYSGTHWGVESAPNTPGITVQNCKASGTVKGADYVGGILGAEPYQTQCWDNGIGYIRNNLFMGTVVADGAQYKGGIIGYMNSLNAYNVITNNYYDENCGTDKGIGFVRYIDTNAETTDKTQGAEYYNTAGKEETGRDLEGYPHGFIHADHNRSDDPVGADAGKLARAANDAELKDGTITALLNNGAGSCKNWSQEENGPIHGSEASTLTATLTLDPDGGNVDGSQQPKTYRYNAYMSDQTLPTPLARSGYQFLGWYLGQQRYTSYPENPKDLTFVAHWKKIETTAPTENTVTVTFRLIGSTLAKEDVNLSDGDYKGAAYVTWIPTKTYTLPEGSTVYDLYTKALSDAGIRSEGQDSNYVKTIYAPAIHGGYALSEFTNGVNSGWMYTVNGDHPLFGLQEQKLRQGDRVIWHYVNDYAWEVKDWGMTGGTGWPQLSTQGKNYWDKWLEAADTAPTTPLPEETPSLSEDVAASIKGDSAEVSVSASDLAALADAAGKDGSAAVQINVTGADKADKVTVELPKASVSNIANKTDAALQVTTPQGIVTMDKQAMKEAVKAASGSDLTIALDKQEIADASKEPLGSTAAQTKVSILSGGKEIKDLGTAKVKILLPVSDAVKDKAMAAAAVDEDGKLTKTEGKLVTVNGKTYYQIETSKPGTFVVAESANIDAAIKAQAAETDDEKLARIKKGVQNTTIKITKTSKGKGWIKIKWKKSKGYKVDYYEVFRKTGKNTKFGKKAFYKTKKHGITGSYKNTKALKKGKRYYYKVRGVRVIDGKKYYTKWSRAYYRIAK